jgi:hypothetical protein
MYVSRSAPTFRKEVLPPSGLKSKPQKAESGSFETPVDFCRNIRRHILESSTLQYSFGYEFESWWWRTKPVEQTKTLQILWCWTLSIFLSLSKNTILFIFQNITFWRLGSVSVFRTGPGPVMGTSSIDWAQLSMFYLKTETEPSLRNLAFWKINRAVFLDKDRTMDNVQQHNICTNVPSSQTFRSYKVKQNGGESCWCNRMLTVEVINKIDTTSACSVHRRN